MRYYNRARDSGSAILDHYTGVGEVLAVHALDGVFGSFTSKFGVKRGSLFSLDDAKNNDLIFMGSPSENLTLWIAEKEDSTLQADYFWGPAWAPWRSSILIPDRANPKSSSSPAG